MANQIALILGVGAEDGIGGALCKRAAQDGYHVVAVGRTEEKLRKIVGAINNNGGKASSLCRRFNERARDRITIYEDRRYERGIGLRLL